MPSPLPLATPRPGEPAIATGGRIPAGYDSPDEGGYRICIDVSAAGELAVGLESDASNAVVDPGTDKTDAMAAGSMKPCADIKAALTEALRLYKANDGGLIEQRGFDQAFMG